MLGTLCRGGRARQVAQDDTKQAADKIDKKIKPDSKRRNVLIGLLVVVILLLIGVGVIRHFWLSEQNTANINVTSEVGLIDWEQVIAAHPDYERYKQLQAACTNLELETQSVADIFQVQSPEVADKPFNDAVQQKGAHDVIGGRAELERKANKIRNEYIQATDADYQTQRKAIDAEYLDAILNIRIKLDNQESMHNWLDSKQAVADERANWNEQLQNLQRERGERQRQLYEARQNAIAAHVKEVLGPEFMALQQSLPQMRAEQEAAAANAQSAAQLRNAKTIEQQMEVAQKVQQRLLKRQELADKKSELKILEAHILNDIVGRASKVAILHHLTLIIVDHPKPLTSFMPSIGGEKTVNVGRAIGVNTVDVTDELVQEIGQLTDSAS